MQYTVWTVNDDSYQLDIPEMDIKYLRDFKGYNIYQINGDTYQFLSTPGLCIQQKHH